MVDLPLLMFKKEQMVAEDSVRLLDIFSLPNITEDSDRDTVYNRITEPLNRGKEEKGDTFDAEAFAALRTRLTGR